MFITKRIKTEQQLAEVLYNNAKEFNGLYNGLNNILLLKNKKSKKALGEFYKRISHIKGYEGLSRNLEKYFPADNLPDKKVKKLAAIVFRAMNKADISHIEQDILIVLTVDNAAHYQEWDGKNIYVGSKVKVVAPAWYQNNTLIEEGFCTLEE